MKKATIQLEDLACPSCALKIEGAVKAVKGVGDDSAKVMFNASKVKLTFNEEETSLDEITAAIKNVGYDVLSAKE
ncbi:metal-binding protein [Dolosicoccus paucivorans]|uniref:heavy-metal-associated domain-containing protein n=1 Tax=Dolosicoccus paucivorans TaxID=84521 RepID=UPI000C802AE9|nr:heavy-metal-associated domain-containing protein [Dolosicoccus paucivorans]PMB83767.1 metal-binding protein [Dolosicoccus paucivorans]